MSPSEQSSEPVILLVEEENDERQAIASHLQQAGFTVIEATDSDGAMRVLNKHARVHGIVTDAHVPGKIDGFELAGLARQRWPELAVVMMSGHSDRTSGPVPENAEFIAKPYLTSHLVPTLRRLIGRNA